MQTRLFPQGNEGDDTVQKEWEYSGSIWVFLPFLPLILYMAMCPYPSLLSEKGKSSKCQAYFLLCQNVCVPMSLAFSNGERKSEERKGGHRFSVSTPSTVQCVCIILCVWDREQRGLLIAFLSCRLVCLINPPPSSKAARNRVRMMGPSLC